MTDDERRRIDCSCGESYYALVGAPVPERHRDCAPATTEGALARMRQKHVYAGVVHHFGYEKAECACGAAWPCDAPVLVAVAEAARVFLFMGDTIPQHDTGCAVYDPYEHGPCDCGAEALRVALDALEQRPGTTTTPSRFTVRSVG